MKKCILLVVVFSFLLIPAMLFGYSLRSTIDIDGQSYSYGKLVQVIDMILPESPLESYKRYEVLEKYLYAQMKKEGSSGDIEKYQKLGEILALGKKQKGYLLETELQKIILGYSEEGREIVGYFRGLPGDGYNLIIGNIHGAYEYGTYETANMLIENMRMADTKGWFIIPTLNPDGLELYFQNGNTLSAYIEGRANSNGVDLNRNFCTKNFRLREFQKFNTTLLTGRKTCSSEAEIKVAEELFESMLFHKIITLHSAGGLMYIPDGSIDDERVISLGKNLQAFLPEYDFNPQTGSERLRQLSIQKYEMDEGDSGNFTGTLETYVYENYDIPTVLIELVRHGEVEERLGNIFTHIQ